MFTGIIKEVGKILRFRRIGRGAEVVVESFEVINELDIGDSVCVNGVCLTVARKRGFSFAADLSSETLARTNFRLARPGMLVNLEPSLRVGDKLGGHFVTGHVDGCGRVIRLLRTGTEALLSIKVPSEMKSALVPKGSVAVNGVSLTVARIVSGGFEVFLIPETLKATNLKRLRPGDVVNVELDMLLKRGEVP